MLQRPSTPLPHRSRRLAGFSLVEIAMLVLLGGIILSAYTEMERVTRRQDKIDIVRERLTRIDTAIGLYLTRNAHLPCPAPLMGVPESQRDSATYGLETSCAGAPAAGVQISGTAPNAVYYGAVPTRTLNLPDEYMVDPWGNRFTYAVTGPLATTVADYQVNDGLIIMKDPAGVNYPSPAAFAVVSAGQDGAGAYTDNGNVLHRPCETSPTATRDSFNCLFNAADMRANSPIPANSLYSERAGATHFDDHVQWTPKKAQVLGAINRYIFDTMACTPIAGGCATVAANMATISNTGYSWNPQTGPMLYDRTFTAESTGTAAIKVLVPVRYDNKTVADANLGIGGYEPAFLAALYVNGAPIVYGDVVNPPGIGIPETIFPIPYVQSQQMFMNIGGASGTIMGQVNITKGVNYTVRVYLFSLDPSILFMPTGITFWAGTIKAHDYNIEGVVEIMESGIE